MKITLNGELREFPEPQSVETLLVAAGYAQRRVAVEVNREIVPKSRHAEHALADNDRVEIIQAIGGG
ncbi:MAG: sulfur carrier protein ThiS [Arenimonas sp.]|nr:sulfur carrier protein ThiS [Arenimonas sp.]